MPTRKQEKRVGSLKEELGQDASTGHTDEVALSKKTGGKASTAKSSSERVDRPYPRVPLQEAMKVALTIKEKNGGNPWDTSEVAKALGLSKTNNRFFYAAAASRDFGLTEGGRDSKTISLTELGRKLVYAGNPEEEESTKREAFLKVPVFKSVLEHYGGSNLPEMQYLSNTLQKEFGLHPLTHEEFASLFRENCDFIKIGARFGKNESRRLPIEDTFEGKSSSDVVTIAEPEQASALKCFVAMPFRERTDRYNPGYFEEVLNSLIGPAGRQAGFNMVTAKRQGTDVIQATIIKDLLEADLVLVDLTEHNPNVLLELGIRLAKDRPVVLIRAEGTPGIFDVDNMLRVFDYSPNLWQSTLKHDVPKLAEHIKATWDNRDGRTYMQILLASGGA